MAHNLDQVQTWQERHDAKMRQYWRDQQRRSRERAHQREILQIWEWAGEDGPCRFCGVQGCRQRICRTLDRFCHLPNAFHRREYMRGQYWPLWVAIRYLLAMANGEGHHAVEFGKRFAHRRVPNV